MSAKLQLFRIKMANQENNRCIAKKYYCRIKPFFVSCV